KIISDGARCWKVTVTPGIRLSSECHYHKFNASKYKDNDGRLIVWWQSRTTITDFCLAMMGP
ncbi:MAG: hypothetical protein WAO07_20855, partial [Desulfobacterales bacterium]